MWLSKYDKHKGDAASEGIAQIQKAGNSTIGALENLEKRKVNTDKTEHLVSHLPKILKGMGDGTLSEDETRAYVKQLLDAGLAGSKLEEERLRILNEIEESEADIDV